MRFKKILVPVLIMTLVMTFSFTMPGMAFADEAQDGVRFGTVEEYSTFEPGTILEDAFYYDDNWFSQPASERNDALALVSMQLVASAIENDKTERCVDFLKKLGFENFISTSLSEGNDALGYTVGMKKVGDDTLACMVVHSYAFDQSVKETAWVQNFTINSEDVTSGEQYAYQKAVAQFDAAALKAKVEEYAVGSSGKVKFWVTGQSRGGALADLAAVKLKESAGADEVFAYTFEAPNVVDADAIDTTKDYSYIHNYITEDDIVTLVPPWGMVHYGSDYGIKAALSEREITNDDINTILEMIGSKAKFEDVDGLEILNPNNIIKVLEERIGSRAGYSEKRTDTFKPLDGDEDVTLEYDYQTEFQNFIRVLFGKDGLKTDGIADSLNEFLMSFESVIRGYMIEAGEIPETGFAPEAYYWDSAVKAYEILDSLDSEMGNLPLTKMDVYTLLKLVAPIAIDKSHIKDEGNEITDEPMTIEMIAGYLTPVVILVAAAGQFTIPHHFDVLIARLKALTSYPDTGDISLEIPEPTAGESYTKTPRNLANACEDMGISWLNASAKWDTEDRTIRKNKVYYLEAEFEVVGHNIPKDVNVTINGMKPIASPKVTFRDGVATIKGIWKFSVGSPQEYTLTFKSFDYATPDPMTVPYGEKLKYVDPPVMDEQEGTRFDGWEYEFQYPWESITVTGDMVFFDKWVEVIDEIEVNFPIPVVGQTAWKMPYTPEYSSYSLEKIVIRDNDYNDVDVIPTGELTLAFDVIPGYETEFKVEDDEYGFKEYAGTITVNGEEVYAYYNEEDNRLRVEYYFEADPGPQKGNDGTAIGKGASLSVANSFLTGWLSNKDPKGAKFAPLKLRSGKQTKNSITLNWSKSSKAVQYIVYGNLSGSENKLKKLKTLSGNTFTAKKISKALKSGKYYKFMVVALDKNQKVVSTSKMIHVATKGANKATNYKALKIQVKKVDGKYKTVTAVTLKKGKTAQIKATPVKISSKAKVRSILGIRYESSNPKVAKVTAKGQIKAVKKGTCTIYIFTQNGIKKTVKVTVK